MFRPPQLSPVSRRDGTPGMLDQGPLRGPAHPLGLGAVARAVGTGRTSGSDPFLNTAPGHHSREPQSGRVPARCMGLESSLGREGGAAFG